VLIKVQKTIYSLLYSHTFHMPDRDLNIRFGNASNICKCKKILKPPITVNRHLSVCRPPLVRPSSAPRPPLVRPSSAPRPPLVRPSSAPPSPFLRPSSALPTPLLRPSSALPPPHSTTLHHPPPQKSGPIAPYIMTSVIIFFEFFQRYNYQT
jgi:hypothetical protein